jgi:hypothetical protein
MKSFLCGALFSLGCAMELNAHPIHTTLTKVSRQQGTITLTVRTFADDFSAVVAKFSGRRAPGDSSVVPAEVLRYVQATFRISNGRGVAVTLGSCGIRRANELYWLCFRATIPQSDQSVRLRNRMLTELHSDQVNVVQTELPASRRTLLFTKTSPFAAIE